MREKDTMTLLNKQGVLETFNIHTGEKVAQEGELVASHLYSLEIADAICNLLREGKTLTKISEMDAMPALHLIYAWRARHPDFKKSMGDARKDRGTYYHDKAVDELEDLGDDESRDRIGLAKFKFDSFLKLAERSAPAEYGQATTAAGGNSAPTMIVINTGIDRNKPVLIKEVYDEASIIGERELGGLRQAPSLGAETFVDYEGTGESYGEIGGSESGSSEESSEEASDKEESSEEKKE